MLAALVTALALWGLGQPSALSSNAQAAVHGVCVKGVSAATAGQGSVSRQVCPVGGATFAEAAFDDAVDSEPLQHDRQLMPGRTL